MTELTGFTTVQKLGINPVPQSLRVPRGKAAAGQNAALILGALWDAVDYDLTPNIKIEILKGPDGVTFCRISPLQHDAITRTVANPGDWIAVDGSRLLGMPNDDYAAQFTQDIPFEWDAVSTPPTASVGADGKVTLHFPQPTSANRPFAYAVKRGEGEVGASAPVVVDGQVTLPVDLTLAEGESAELTVTVTATKYGTTATSAAVTASRPASAQ